MISYVKSLFEDHICLFASMAWGAVSTFLFPESAYITASAAVLGMMALDLLTKLYALSKQTGGLRKALKQHKINSKSFAKGTMDKLVVFGVLLIICGCAYRISPIESLATWFMQVVFSLMFLRDTLSIIENLTDAGVGGLSLFKRVVNKKLNEYVDEEGSDAMDTENKNTDTPI
ncbi:MAG: phage holin family protein [Eubacteriales bacterium]|jgi:phage-related holin